MRRYKYGDSILSRSAVDEANSALCHEGMTELEEHRLATAYAQLRKDRLATGEKESRHG